MTFPFYNMYQFAKPEVQIAAQIDRRDLNAFNLKQLFVLDALQLLDYTLHCSTRYCFQI